jgi:hypothetical protein
MDLIINGIPIDVVVTAIYRPDYITTGHSATQKEVDKRRHYHKHYEVDDSDIHPFAVETRGALGSSTMKLFDVWLQAAPVERRRFIREALSLATRRAMTARFQQCRFGSNTSPAENNPKPSNNLIPPPEIIATRQPQTTTTTTQEHRSPNEPEPERSREEAAVDLPVSII